MTDVRIVRVEYADDSSPADQWMRRLIERLLVVKLELEPKDVAHFLMSTTFEDGDSRSSEEV